MLDNTPDTLTLKELQAILQIGKILLSISCMKELLQDIGLVESGFSLKRTWKSIF